MKPAPTMPPLRQLLVRALLLLACTACVITSPVAAQDVTDDNATAADTAKPSVLQTLMQTEATFQANSALLTRQSNFNVLSNSVNGNGDLAQCNLVEMNRHSFMAGPSLQLAFPNGFPLQVLAVISLAMEHLNAGNGRVIPALEGLPDRCNIRFTADFIDTVGSEAVAVDEVIQRVENSLNDTQLPCAFVGAFRSQVSVATSIITGIKGYPQFSALSNAEQLSDPDTFPLFGRVIPTNSLYGRPLLGYLHSELNVRNLCVVYIGNSNGLSYFDGIRSAAAEYFPDMNIRGVAYDAIDAEQVDNDGTNAWTIPVIRDVKNTQIQYIFAISSNNEHAPLMAEAYRQGIAGDGKHTWIFSNAISAQRELGNSAKPDDPVFLASKGALTFTTIGSLPNVGRFNELVEAYQELDNPTDMEYIRQRYPKHPEVPTYAPQVTSALFAKSAVNAFIPLFYDVVIAMGLGACKKQMEATTPSDAAADRYPTGPEHFANTLNTTFVGASGTLGFVASSGNRDPSTTLFVISNFIPQDDLDAETGQPNGNLTLSIKQIAYFDDGKWNTTEDIVFNDGTTDIPLDLPEQKINTNYISSGLRIGGYVMSAIIMSSAVALMVWTQLNSSSRTVRASQPIFLHFVGFGTILMGSSIIPLSFDEEIASEDGCDLACVAFPWLLSIGWCISISALFTKTHRVNKIFHNPNFRRVKVTVMDVLPPMIGCLSVNIIVLLVWSILSPLEWNRETLQEDAFGRAKETRGQCQSENSLVYIILLGVINFGVLIYAIYEAYVARKISTEFAESEYIARAMSIICMVGFLGIPLVYIADSDDAQSFFFVMAAIIFIGCMALLYFIFVPKIIFHRKEQEKLKKKLRTSQQFRLDQQQHQQYTNAGGGNGVTFTANATTSVTRPSSHRIDHTGKLNTAYPITTSTLHSQSESSDVGAVVMEHPKLKESLELKYKLLKRNVQGMQSKIQDMEQIITSSNTMEDIQLRYEHHQQKFGNSSNNVESSSSGSNNSKSKPMEERAVVANIQYDDEMDDQSEEQRMDGHHDLDDL